jgi:hypothetical protein
MTRYTVVWDEQVESQFLRAWLRGDSHLRSILTDIANWIDRELAVDPEQKGLAVDEPDTRVLRSRLNEQGTCFRDLPDIA